MALNMKKALKLIQKDLEKNWKSITFSYEQTGKDEIKVNADVNLNAFDDDITLVIKGTAGGGFWCRAVFDKIDKTPEVLDLVNSFNDDEIFFKAYVRDDGYLELTNFFICYDEKVYGEYASEFLIRLADLDENQYMKQLSALTKDE